MNQKLFTVAVAVATVFAASSAFGQGYVTFSCAPHSVWDEFGPDAPTIDRSEDVTFLWAPTGTPDPLGAATPTNNANISGLAWSEIGTMLTSGWQVAYNLQTSNLQNSAYAIATPTATAGILYGQFQLANAPGGSTVEVVAVAWDAASGTNAIFTEEGQALGWSNPFNYVTGTNSSDPNGTLNFTGSGMQRFGVGSAPGPGQNALAPYIINQPQSQTVLVGGIGTLDVVASGVFPQYYQWFQNGAALSGATNSQLVLADVSLAAGGPYWVTVSNSLGLATSSTVYLNVTPPGAPTVYVNGNLVAVTAAAGSGAVITMTPGFTNGFVFYTLDGSTPSDSSTYYTGPFTITNSATIKAVCYSSDFSQTAFMQPLALQIVPVYYLNTSVVGGGSISESPIGSSFPSNTVVNLEAVPAAYWAFERWQGDITSYGNPIDLFLDTNLNIQAVFSATAYPLTLTTAGGGTVQANGGPATYLYFPTNSSVTITAAANSGWTFLDWQGGISNSLNPYNLTMTQPYNIQGVFGTPVLTNAAGAGQIVLSPTNPIPYGANVTASALADNGDYFLTWSGAASGTNSPTMLTVTNANPTVSALFVPLPAGKLSLSVIVQGNGSVGINPQQSYYNKGDVVTLTATPNDQNTSFYGWSGNSSQTNSTIQVTMTTNLIVQANFVLLPPPPSAPSITSQPQDFVATAYGAASFGVTATGTLPISYQWSVNGSNILNATNSVFSISSVHQSDLGQYGVLVTNPYGAIVSSPANLYMYPYIASPFTGLDTYWGQTNTLGVGAWGSGTLTYQWYQNGVALAGATNSTLTFQDIQFTNAGSYYVVVSSSLGSVTNFTYQVIVNPANIAIALFPAVVIQGTVGFTYTIESTTNLSNPNAWIVETNLTLTQPIEDWNDNSADVRTGPRKFYQVLPGQ